MGSKIPIYPDFKKIEIEDKDFFNKVLYKFPPYSDFNLLSILSWGAMGGNCFSTLNGNLVIKIKDYLSDNFQYSIIGESEIDLSLHKLLSDFNSLSFVPEVVINQIKSTSEFKVTHDRDNDDYVISLPRLTKLEGADLRTLRHHLNVFTGFFPSHQVEVLDVTNADTMDEIRALNMKWFAEKNFDEEKQRQQAAIVETFFKYSSQFNCVHLGLFIDDKMVTYYSNEILKSKIIMGHFGAITNKDFKDCVSMMQYEVARFFVNQGYSFQNVEQDTGLSGLRQAKLSYDPEYFLKKYSITLN